jgi:hypothetical protein
MATAHSQGVLGRNAPASELLKTSAAAITPVSSQLGWVSTYAKNIPTADDNAKQMSCMYRFLDHTGPFTMLTQSKANFMLFLTDN